MDSKTIKKFKRFLTDNGVNTLFAGFYSSFKYQGNPDSVEDFLAIVPDQLVIPYAFDATKISNPQFGLKFWDKLDERWKSTILKLDNRRSMESTAQQIAEAQERKEQRKNEESIVNDEIYPFDDTKGLVVKHDWAGLDLVDVSKPTRAKQYPMPNENEVRVSVKSKPVMVLSYELVKMLDGAGLDSMTIQRDARTNMLVLVFGQGLDYNVSMYSTDVKCVQYKAVMELLQKYIFADGSKFDPSKMYYVKIAQRVWNHNHSRYAVVLSQKFTTKER